MGSDDSVDRRAFLRRMAALGFSVPVVGVLAGPVDAGVGGRKPDRPKGNKHTTTTTTTSTSQPLETTTTSTSQPLETTTTSTSQPLETTTTSQPLGTTTTVRPSTTTTARP